MSLAEHPTSLPAHSNSHDLNAPKKRSAGWGRTLQQFWAIVGLALLLALGMDQLAMWLYGQFVHSTPDLYRVGFAEDSGQWLADFSHEMDATVHAFDLDGTSIEYQAYSHWRNKPSQGRYINVEANGLRRTWQPQRAANAPRPLRIFMFGGSAMWGYGNRDDHTIPSQLARQLYEAGQDAEITNFGQIGYVTSQEFATLTNELNHGNFPNLVIFLDGYNDLSSAYLNQQAGLPLTEAQRRQEFNLSQRGVAALTDAALENSGTMRLLGLARGKQAARAASDRPDFNLEQCVLDTATVLLNNYRSVEALGREYGFDCLFYLQPVLYATSHRTDWEQKEAEGRDGQKNLVLTTFELIGRLQQRVPPDHPLAHDFADLSALFDTPEWADKTAFYDRAHLTEPANAFVASRMKTDVLARIQNHADPKQP